jgi:very-short-patch-repair endonuclease
MEGSSLSMPGKVDLAGKRFRNLLVVSQADNIHTPNGRSHVAWNCICDCGKKTVVRGDFLRNGHTISCGCVKKANLRQAGVNRKIDLTGKVFGYLTILEDTGKRYQGDGNIIWKCRCECGNVIEVLAGNLLRKKEHTISCGCKKSKGEKKILDILYEEQIDFITQKRFSTCVFPKTHRQLAFDFYLPAYNILIEYDGIQHFEETKNGKYNLAEIQERDLYKDTWCKENNITLVRIPYTDFDILDVRYIRRIIQRNGWTEVH